MKSRIVACLLVLVLPTWAAQAQPVWQLIHKYSVLDWDITAIGSFENVYTAGAQSLDGKLVFLRSDDAGLTWREQFPPKFAGFYGAQNIVRKIQQIDRLHVIAFADSLDFGGLVIKTDDAGKTWKRMTLPDFNKITDIHFSDAATGIFAAEGRITQPASLLYTTTDSGNTWKNIPLNGFFDPVGCHSYGGGMFRIWGFPNGPLYTTHDNFASIDSIVNDPTPNVLPRIQYLLGHCRFGNGDTMIFFGVKIDSIPWRGLLYRTVDGGHHWTSFPIAENIHGLETMSEIDRDTIFASGPSYESRILMSTDRGASWRLDSMVIDTAGFYPIYAYDITVPQGGPPIALLSNSEDLGRHSGIFRLKSGPSSGIMRMMPNLTTGNVYPNPTTESVTITTPEASGTIHLLDILGREVLRASLSADGRTKLDLVALPRGIYTVMLESHKGMGRLGKLAIVN